MNLKQTVKNAAAKVKNVNVRKCGRWAILAGASLVAGVVTALTLTNAKFLVVVSQRVDALETTTQTLTGRADLANQQQSALVKVIGEVKDQAARANSRQDRRVKAENQDLRNKLGYIRGANPGFALASMSAKQIDKLLTNGIWDVEPQIVAEYQRLQSESVAVAQLDAETAQESARNAEYTASQALDAGETAITAVRVMVDQPNKPLRHSVSNATKGSISGLVADYIERCNSDATIKQGAPEE